MRRIGEIMEDLGFDKNGSVDTQKAFIKHLIKAAQVSQKDRKTEPLIEEPAQLSFVFPDESPSIAPVKPAGTKAVG